MNPDDEPEVTQVVRIPMANAYAVMDFIDQLTTPGFMDDFRDVLDEKWETALAGQAIRAVFGDDADQEAA